MNIIHAKRRSNKRKIYVEKRKQLRKLLHENKKAVTYIEDIPNELFYEIFDYLDGYEIYESFSNLNFRFQQILLSSELQLKINLLPFLDLDLQHKSMTIISQQRHQIISLRLMYTSNINRFFTLITFDSSFFRLQSLVFIGIKSDDLLQKLSILTSLPSLISLVLCVEDNLKGFCDMYNLIFHLPVLKYIKLSSEAYEPFIPLTIATDNQFSTIEYLIINHSCNLTDLISILSYTPQLIRLTCREIIRSNENIYIHKTRINLPNLTHICISECYVVFDILELFLKKISSQLELLRVNTYWDVNYLDADRWERLIIEHIPYLRKFFFQYHELIDDDFEITEYHTLLHRFVSSFWITHGYNFELAIDINDWSWSEIIYSIHPYRNKWYEIREMNSNHISIIDFSQNIELTITAAVYRQCNEIFIDNTMILFDLLRITQLDISYSGISADTLINLIHHLPYIDSLRIGSLSLLKSLSNEQSDDYYLLSTKNKITKINIQCLTELSQLQFLIDLCSNLQYLEIGCTNDINPKLIISFILIKRIRYILQLRMLCLEITTANDQILEELQNIINSDKLCYDYIIRRVHNKFYLQWK